MSDFTPLYGKYADSVKEHNETDLPLRISPTDLGQIVKKGQCPRYIAFKTNEHFQEQVFSQKFIQKISIGILSQEGNSFEENMYDDLREIEDKESHPHIDFLDTLSFKEFSQDTSPDTAKEEIVNATTADPDISVFAQVPIQKDMGPFTLAGFADLVCVINNAFTTEIQVFDIKASWDESVDQQIQASCYTLGLRDFIDEDIDITGGIIHKDALDELDLDTLMTSDEFAENSPAFTIDPREDDVERLLSYSGSVYTQLLQTEMEHQSPEKAQEILDSIPYQIDSHCSGCSYRDACFTSALESLDISLLKIGQGERNALRDAGFSTLKDLREILIENTDEDAYFEYTIKEQYQETISKLQQNQGVQNVKKIAKQAEFMFCELHPDKSLPLVGDGSVYTMPSDSELEDYPAVKIYFNVQHDYITDSVIGLSAKITRTDTGESTTISELISDIPYKHDENRVNIKQTQKNERRLLNSVSEQLFEYLGSLFDSSEKHYVHCYTFSEYEQSILGDSLDRHRENLSDESMSLRHLLAERDFGPENDGQIMWSAIEKEFKRAYFQTGLPTFLPYVYEKFHNSDGIGYSYSYNNQKYNVRHIFDEQFFDFRREYTVTDNGLELSPPSEYTINKPMSNDKYWEKVPVESYDGSQIPLEYLWGCSKYDLSENMFTDEDDEESDNQFTYIEHFLYKNPPQTGRISGHMVSALLEWNANALEFIESEMNKYKRSTELASVTKEALASHVWTDFESYTLDSFADSVREYAVMEHIADITEHRSEFEKSPESRIQGGKSVPMVITRVTEPTGRTIKLVGEIAYKSLGFSNLNFLESSMRLEEGDYVSLNKFDVADGAIEVMHPNREDSTADPVDMLNAPTAKVEEIDMENNLIVLQHYKSWGKEPFGFQSFNIETPTNPQNYKPFSIDPPERVLLESSISSYLIEQQMEVLEHLEHNPLYQRIEGLMTGSRDTKECEFFAEEDLEDFVSMIDSKADNGELENIFKPKPQHRDLITNTSETVVMQGPPGTGKTRSAAALSISARIHAYEGYGATGLITGPSNTAVDEILESTADVVEELGLNATLIRYHSQSSPPVAEHKSCVKNFTDAEEVEHALNGIGSGVLFATGSKIQTYFSDSQSEDSQYEHPNPVFDFFMTDEASMQTLPAFFQSGAFIKENAQVILSGDHRQMSPVQKHEWVEESRPSIQKFVPYLSALNMFRFIRGDSVERINDDNSYIIDSPEKDISFVQLEETFRCHSDVASFLQEYVYQKDDLNYHSNRNYTIDASAPTATEPVQIIGDENPFVVVTHSESESQEANWTESSIAKAIAEMLDDETLVHEDEETNPVGVVAPHNSQKGLMKGRLPNTIDVDTVERFQGSSREAIIVSSTVSDPSYIEKEDDFLLNPNRINVAMSRMKRLLVVIVPETVFDHIPAEVETYDNSMIWNGLYSHVIDDTESEWSGSLTEFTDNDADRDDITVNVYTK